MHRLLGASNLNSVLFLGAAPTVGASALGNIPAVTVYRLPDTAGWPAPGQPWADQPTQLGLPPIGRDGGLGMQAGQFGFRVGWAAHSTQVVIEAASDLNAPDWQPMATASNDFRDPDTASHSQRFYRVRHR